MLARRRPRDDVSGDADPMTRIWTASIMCAPTAMQDVAEAWRWRPVAACWRA
jgi:hypothetical protein